MNISVEMILGVIGLVFIILSAREYLSNGRRFTPKVKAWLRVSAIFVVVIIFNLFVIKS